MEQLIITFKVRDGELEKEKMVGHINALNDFISEQSRLYQITLNTPVNRSINHLNELRDDITDALIKNRDDEFDDIYVTQNTIRAKARQAELIDAIVHLGDFLADMATVYEFSIPPMVVKAISGINALHRRIALAMVNK